MPWQGSRRIGEPLEQLSGRREIKLYENTKIIQTQITISPEWSMQTAQQLTAGTFLAADYLMLVK